MKIETDSPLPARAGHGGSGLGVLLPVPAAWPCRVPCVYCFGEPATHPPGHGIRLWELVPVECVGFHADAFSKLSRGEIADHFLSPIRTNEAAARIPETTARIPIHVCAATNANAPAINANTTEANTSNLFIMFYDRYSGRVGLEVLVLYSSPTPGYFFRCLPPPLHIASAVMSAAPAVMVSSPDPLFRSSASFA